MKKHLIHMLTPVAMCALSVSVSVAAEQKPLELKQIETATPSDYDGDFVIIDEPTCNMVVPPYGSPDTKFIIEGEIFCAPGDLQAPGSLAYSDIDPVAGLSNAAINVMGDGITVIISDKVNCGGDIDIVDGTSSADFTDTIPTIGVWVDGTGNRILGKRRFSDEGSTDISSCNVDIEVGYTSSATTGTPIDGPEIGLNLIEAFILENCNSGLRFLNSGNRGHDLIAACGLQQIDTTVAPADFPSVSSDGFVVGINALGKDTSSNCMDVNSLKLPVYFNSVTGSDATANNNGFLLGNQMVYLSRFGNFQIPTNLILGNGEGTVGISGNYNAGALLAGTGFVVAGNESSDNGGFGAATADGIGILMSLNKPECNPNVYDASTGAPPADPNSILTNLVIENESYGNAGYGMAALLGSTAILPNPLGVPPTISSTPADNAYNAGTVFRHNHVYKNNQAATPSYDYFDENLDCANGESEWYFLNEWRKNKGQHFFNTPTSPTANVACILNQFKSDKS